MTEAGNPDWLVISLSVPAHALEHGEETLWAAGAQSITLLDEHDDPVLEPAPGETPLWPVCRAEALFEPRRVAVAALLDELRARIPEARGWAVRHLADRAWERAWMETFKPMRFGQRLWIYPSHCEPPAGGDQVVLRLDPGLAFGSGTHATTALCLEWLAQSNLDGAAVLDYGCGSGVLAIAALLLGAAQAQAVDIDPQALAATARNAERNGVAARLATLDTNQPCAPSELIVANILARPLLQLAPRLAALHLPGGRLALTGLLAAQRNEIEQAYAAWYRFESFAQREDWILLGARRNHSPAP